MDIKECDISLLLLSNIIKQTLARILTIVHVLTIGQSLGIPMKTYMCIIDINMFYVSKCNLEKFSHAFWFGNSLAKHYFQYHFIRTNH